MIGNDAAYLIPDAQMLKDRGFIVYTSNEDNFDGMIEETKPDVIFVNYNNPGLNSTRIYHSILDNVKFANIPVVYTLSEDDVYLINKSRTTMSRDKRNIICDNIIDSIKAALLDNASFTRKSRVKISRKDLGNDNYQSYATRA
jgi:PleD family two-component response regulator